jgi:hypothetical protein
MIQSSACQPWHVDPPGLAGEHGGFVGTYTISWDTILISQPSLVASVIPRTFEEHFKAIHILA